MAFQALALAIRNTLIDQGVVELPGIGKFTLNYFPARLSRIESTLYPPSKKVSFQKGGAEHLDLHKLGLHYANALSTLSDQQGRSLESDLNGLASLVLNGESVELHDVGQFFNNEKSELDFVASGFNYHLDVYGLGPINARPLQRRTAAQAASEAIAASGLTVPKKNIPSAAPLKDRLFLPVLAGVFLLAIGVSIWLLIGPDPSPTTPVTSERLEPQTADTESYSDEEALRNGSDVVDSDTLDQISNEEEMIISSPAEVDSPIPGVEQSLDPLNIVTIVVGHFGDEDNVKRVRERLTILGLENSTKPSKNLTRVMVHVKENTSNEILALIRREFDKGAWILDRESQ
ncbi:MAG: hypothetical protein KA479_00175 [Saprospiraceae bacterium]|nr:hypothetical protein [Saprospiraceae bacterium]